MQIIFKQYTLLNRRRQRPRLASNAQYGGILWYLPSAQHSVFRIAGRAALMFYQNYEHAHLNMRQSGHLRLTHVKITIGSDVSCTEPPSCTIGGESRPVTYSGVTVRGWKPRSVSWCVHDLSRDILVLAMPFWLLCLLTSVSFCLTLQFKPFKTYFPCPAFF